MTLYATLAQAKIQMQANATVGVEQAERRLLDLIRVASRRVDALMDPLGKRVVFAPHIATRTLRVSGYDVNSYDGTLRLNESLLALDGVTLGATVLTDVEAWPAGVTPIEYLRLTGCCGSWYADPACTAYGGPLVVTVAGTWGLHRDYANAWQTVDALAAGIDASVTTLTVADADGADSFGITPRLSPGHLVRIGDELMEVTAVNTTTNVVTVRRGVNGSTAASHDASAAVETFVVEEPVRYAVARQAALMTARYGAYTTVEVTAAGSEIRYPVDLLAELKGVLAEYSYGR